MPFTSKIAIVTGAASGIGRATAFRLSELGAYVIACDAVPVSPDIGSEQHLLDVSAEAAVSQFISAALERHGVVHILVNCAGVSGFGALEELSTEVWDHVLSVNLRGTMLLCRAVLPGMKARGSGVIVNTGSTFGQIAHDGCVAYAVSKAGVIHLTKCLAVDLADSGVRVNCVCPGLIDTPMTAALFTPQLIAFGEREIAAHAMRRAGKAGEVADTIAFLVSDQASFITGATIPVDGGYTAGKW